MSPKAALYMWGGLGMLASVALVGVGVHAFVLRHDPVEAAASALESGQRVIYTLASGAVEGNQKEAAPPAEKPADTPGAETPAAGGAPTATPEQETEAAPTENPAEAEPPAPVKTEPEAPAEKPIETPSAAPAETAPVAEATPPAEKPAEEEKTAETAPPAAEPQAETAKPAEPAPAETAQPAPTEKPAAPVEAAKAPPVVVPPQPAPRYPGGSDVQVASLPAPDLAEIPARAGTASRPASPNPQYASKGPHGSMPAIAANGEAPWRFYGKPFSGSSKPLVAIVVTGLGLNKAATESAFHIAEEVTLSFTPYAPGLGTWLSKARESGHEVMLDLPMQPADYPYSDPGPQAMLTGLSPNDNIGRLYWVLARDSGIIGVTAPRGEKFTSAVDVSVPLAQAVQKQGLLFFSADDGLSQKLLNLSGRGKPPVFNSTVILDSKMSTREIDASLARLEELAEEHGYAIGSAQAYPVTLTRIHAWASGLAAKSVALAPLSAVAQKL